MIKLFRALIERLNGPGHRQYSTPGPFVKLPPEIFNVVLEYLDLNEKICFSLCCCSLRNLIGSDIWRELAVCAEERRVLLKKLGSGGETFFYCHDCTKLHPRIRLCFPPIGPLVADSEQLYCQMQMKADNHLRRATSAHAFRSTYRLVFPHIQVALEEHRRNPHSQKACSDLSMIEICDWLGCSGSNEEAIQATLLSVEAEITNSELYLWMQQWAVFKSTSGQLASVNLRLMVCQHIQRLGSYSQWSLDEVESEANLHGLQRCPVCKVEFILSVQRAGKINRFSVIATKWLLLGDGVDPRAPVWTRHTSRRIANKIQKVTSTRTSLRRAFEQKSSISWRELTTQNAALIVDGVYKDSLGEGRDGNNV